uniref:Putative ovule protein n=1 Tax=Solanum chacoense TaxID=4108 RepID=A0A0V0GT99_SOLCH
MPRYVALFVMKYCNLASSHLFSSSHACYSSRHYSALAWEIIALKNLGPSQRSGPSQLATAHLYITRDAIYIHSNHKHFDTLQLNVGKYCPIGNETFICRLFFLYKCKLNRRHLVSLL